MQRSLLSAQAGLGLGSRRRAAALKPAQRLQHRLSWQPQRRLVVVAARDPYQLLGVPRTASLNEIKRAFRKKALKLHPDVNKAPDAKERFMECKNAYQQLLDEKERGGSSSPGSSSWASGWASGQSYGTGGRTGSTAGGSRAGAPPPPPEESYGFGDLVDYAAGFAYGLGQGARSTFDKTLCGIEDFLRDLEKEFSEYSKEKSAKAGASSSSGGAMKGLWEELADIGEEFVEFLEQELGLSDDDSSNAAKRSNTVSNGAGTANRSNTNNSSSSSRTAQQQQPSSGYREPPPPPPKQPQKSRAEEVEDELEALKRKLGMK